MPTRVTYQCPECQQTYTSDFALSYPPDCNHGHETRTMKLTASIEYEPSEVANLPRRERVGGQSRAISRAKRVGVVRPVTATPNGKRGPQRVGLASPEASNEV